MEYEKYINEIKSRNNIVDVISSYIELNHKGGRFWACCPFHHEKTPSFSVDENRQMYFCFGCKASGDVIKFVEKVESTDFMGALTILANKVGMDPPHFTNIDNAEMQAKYKEKKRLYLLLKDTALFYHKVLRSEKGQDARKYLHSRGLTDLTITKFGLGYSPDWTSVIRFLEKKGYKKEEMETSGVISSKNGRTYDAYGERVMFPVIDSMKQVVAFSGRSLGDTKYAKYKNTTDTAVFKKGKVLYGLNLIKQLRIEEEVKNIILVEGQMDAITVYNAGFKNVVASMGTAFTKDQAKLLKYMDEVIVSYDGDEAGIKGAIRAIDLLKAEGLVVRVVQMPKGQDPDEVIKSRGKEGYKKLLDNALVGTEFKLQCVRNIYSYNNPAERAKFVRGMLKAIVSLDDRAEEEFYLKEIRDETGLSLVALESDLDDIRRGEKPSRLSLSNNSNDSADLKAVRFMLARAIDEKCEFKDIEYMDNFIANPVHRKIFEIIKSGIKLSPNEYYQKLSEDNHEELGNILNINQIEGITEDSEDDYYNQVRIRYRKLILRQKLEKLNIELAAEEDSDKKRKIIKEITNISLEINN